MDQAKFIELMGDYREKTLQPQDLEHFNQMLKKDQNLASFLKSYEVTTEFCSQILKHKIPDGAQDRLSAYLNNHIKKLRTELV